MIRTEYAQRPYEPPAVAIKILDLAQTTLSESEQTVKPEQEAILTNVRTLIETGIEEEHLPELDGIVVLGASMRYGRVRRRWEFSNIVPSDPNPLIGGHFRITAAKYVYDHGFNGPFLVTGGLQERDSSGKIASKAEVLAQKIQQKIPQADVIPIGTEENGHTPGNVQDFKSYLEKHGIQGGKYAVSTSGWHMPRALTLFLNENSFENDIEFVPLIADDPNRSDTFFHRGKVRKFYGHPNMEERITREAQGVTDVFFGYHPVPKVVDTNESPTHSYASRRRSLLKVNLRR